MDFELDEDQMALQGAAAEILHKECPPALLREVIDGRGGDDGADHELWQTLVGLDWPALAIDPGAGGSGATAVELGLVIEQLGYVCDPTPFLATTTQFAPVVEACIDADQRRRFLGPIASGATGTLALADASGRWDPANPPMSAERTTGGVRLSGPAHFVIDGDRADEIAVLAATDSGPIAVVVPRTSATVTRDTAFDLTMHVTTVDLTGVTVTDDRVLAIDDPTSAFTAALEVAVTGLSLMTVGACQRAFDMALAYSKDRHQFGVPIGSFQALKHKAVDMYTLIERARALGLFASVCIAEGDDRRPLAAAMAKAAAGDAQNLVMKHSVQFFGGIGFTWENDLHLYLRRAKAAELIFGTAAHHRAVVGRSVLSATTNAANGS